MMRSPLMDELSDLDPARHVHAPGTLRDSALHEILGAERGLPRRARRTVPAVAVASVAVVALAVGIGWASVAGAPAAYASWTATPTVVDPAGVDGIDGCPPSASSVVAQGDGNPETVRVALEPVVADVRGEYTFLVQAGEGAVAECFVARTGGEPVVYSSTTTGPVLAEPASDTVEAVQNGVAAWSLGEDSEGAVTAAYGRAGADVRSVTVTLDDGEQVDASVDDGWWVVWAPGEAEFVGPAQVVLDDGTTTQVALETVAATS